MRKSVLKNILCRVVYYKYYKRSKKREITVGLRNYRGVDVKHRSWILPLRVGRILKKNRAERWIWGSN